METIKANFCAAVRPGLSDSNSAATAVAWGAVCAGIWIVAWAIGRIRPRLKWPAYLVGILPFMVCLFLFFENFSRLLPADF